MRAIKEAIGKTMQAAGVIAAAIGACGMDSEELIYPVIIILIGAAVAAIGYKIYPMEDPTDDYCWYED